MTDLAQDTAPQNGWAGLKKHWRYDLIAGLVVSMVSLPLSSGIAIASGAPPIYGIISSIIAGLVFPFVRGSFVTISGPAAGLAPALMAAMIALGGAGTADTVGAGYPLLLVVIFFVGLAQILMAKLGLARFAGIFPSSVVEGMLGAIGILIMVKALPLFFGVTDPGHPHGFVEYLGSIPQWWQDKNQAPFMLGVVGLVILGAAALLSKKWRFFAIVPPHLFAVVVGMILGAVVGLESMFLIQVPANPLSGLQMPAFGQMFSQPALWKAALIAAVTLTLIDGVESLATAQAIDRIDPFKRKSNPNQLLAAMGVSNVLSSLIGGLTIIPGGVKSKTCIEAGGRTLWANFFNAIFLLMFLFIVPFIITLIPKSVLGAILVYTGWKMIHPSIAKHLVHIGKEQFALYVITIVAVLMTDLLVGVLIGTASKLILLAAYAKITSSQPDAMTFGQTIVAFFKSPLASVAHRDNSATIKLDKPLVCFNNYILQEALAKLPEGTQHIEVVIDHDVPMIDHTAYENMVMALETLSPSFNVDGLDEMKAISKHRMAQRLRDPKKWKTKQAAMAIAMSAAIATPTTHMEPVDPSETEQKEQPHA